MKTIFDTPTRVELINRISLLNENSRSQWGKMTAYQMLKHCRLWDEMAVGKKQYKQVFMGRVFGKMALRNLLKNDKPLSHNTPTIPDLRIIDTGDIEAEKNKWIAMMEGYANFSNDNLIHPFFGKMNREQTGCLAYKHTDHHLRQFNV